MTINTTHCLLAYTPNDVPAATCILGDADFEARFRSARKGYTFHKVTIKTGQAALHEGLKSMAAQSFQRRGDWK